MTGKKTRLRRAGENNCFVDETNDSTKYNYKKSCEEFNCRPIQSLSEIGVFNKVVPILSK